VTVDRTLIIVPTYNERENLPILAEQIRTSIPDAHLLIVDDNSPDGTADLADSLFSDWDGASVLRRTGRRGLGRSYVDGYGHALRSGYARVVQMDADLSHDPAYVPELIDASATADVILGSRYCEGGGVRDWPAHRYWLSRFANRYVAVVTGLPIKDSTSGFRCYTRRALEKIAIDRIESNGYAFQVEMTYRASEAGLKIAESPILFTDRLQGKSKISRTVLIESVIMPWRLRFAMNRSRSLQPAHRPTDP
jgi:dolichol-phosphate mannosyltransferase